MVDKEKQSELISDISIPYPPSMFRYRRFDTRLVHAIIGVEAVRLSSIASIGDRMRFVSKVLKLIAPS